MNIKVLNIISRKFGRLLFLCPDNDQQIRGGRMGIGGRMRLKLMGKEGKTLAKALQTSLLKGQNGITKNVYGKRTSIGM
jgi:hypothetical protein